MENEALIQEVTAKAQKWLTPAMMPRLRQK